MLILAVVGVIFFVAHHFSNQRALEIESVAGEIGLNYLRKDDGELHRRFSQFDLLTKGRRQKIENVLIAETDRVALWIFDYRYTVGHGKNSRTHTHSLAVFESKTLEMPEMKIYPEGVFSRIGAAIGFQDIDFDDHPTFSKMFVLKGPDENNIREFLHLDRLDFFSEKKGAYLETKRQSFVYHRGKRRKKPAELRQLLEEVYAVFANLQD